jgi:hypothetical protein
MKRIIYSQVWIFVICLLSACSGSTKHDFQSYVGTFKDGQGVLYELHADSTTLITFSDSITYEGTWAMNTSEDGEWQYVNIEFGGYQRYYYVKDGKIYRSERELRHDAFGSEFKKLK